MAILNIKLPDTSDSVYMKLSDASDSVWVKLPTPSQIQKLTSGGDSLQDQSDTFLNYDVSNWTALPDADPMPLGQINSLAYNPAGTLLAVGKAVTPTLIIYNTITLTSIPGPAAPSIAIRDVDFNKAGTLIAYGSGSTVSIYSVPDWAFIIDLTLPDEVEALDFNHAGTLLAVGVGGFGGDYLHIYDTTTWLRTTGPSGGDEPGGAIADLDYSPDDSLLAVALTFPDSANIAIYNTSPWSRIATPPGTVFASALGCVFNNAQTELLFLQASEDYFIRWDTSTWAILNGTPTIVNQPDSIAINEDDSHVAITTTIGNSLPTLEVYNTSTWVQETLSPLPLSERRMIAVAFQPNF